VRLWRISNYVTLAGTGGLTSPGRWHSRKKEVVYLAESPPAALLERLVHLEIDPDDLPRTYQLLAVEIPDGTAFEAVNEDELPADWRSNDASTWAIGDRWLEAVRTSLLRVPSAITPHTSNWLLNPKHHDGANARIVEVMHAPFDQRLFRLWIVK
jgi:RES domain-containing protein